MRIPALLLLLLAIAGAPALAATDLSLGDATVAEGNTGDTPLRFTVSRTGNLARPVNVQRLHGVSNGYEPATNLTDHTFPVGNVLLPAGQASPQLDVPVHGDTTPEANETFSLVLFQPFEVPLTPAFNAAVAAGTGGGALALSGSGSNYSTLLASNPLTQRRMTSTAGTVSFDPETALHLAGSSALISARCVVFADLNGNYFDDAVVEGGAIFPELGDGMPLELGDRCVAAGDLDRDFNPDLVASNHAAGTVTIQLHQGNTGLAFTKSTQAAGPDPDHLLVADLDGDAYGDIVVANRESGTVTILKNTTNFFSSSLQFASQTLTLPAGTTVERLAIGDIDGDGKKDLAIAAQTPSAIYVFRNTSTPGTIAFAPMTTLTDASLPVAVTIADADGDLIADVAAANGAGSISLFRNTGGPGSFNFSAALTFPTCANPASVVVGDYDANGSPDFAVTCGSGQVSVLPAVTATPTLSRREAIGTILDDDGGDGSPDPVAFTHQTNVPRKTFIESNAVTIAGVNYPVRISVSGGKVSVNGATYATSLPRVSNGDSVRVRHTSLDADFADAVTSITLGDFVTSFTSTTGDGTPDVFSFTRQDNVPASTIVTSNTIMVSGISAATTIRIDTTTFGTGYSIGCNGTFTTDPGTIANGQTVCVHHDSFIGEQSTVLTIGGVSATFTSSVPPDTSYGDSAPSYGGGYGGRSFFGIGALEPELLAGLLAATIWRRRRRGALT